MASTVTDTQTRTQSVSAVPRDIPWPYFSMLTICSDVDCTPDFATYLEIMRFLNTAEETRMGPGLDLDVGNSMYFLAPSFRYAYWNLDDREREATRRLVRSGHIDCLHSIGESARTREHAQQAYDELAAHDCRIEVWVDHSRTPTNFGADIMRGHGDEVGHAAYHADLGHEYGIRYVWRGRVTSVIGQDVPGSLAGLRSGRHPVAGARSWLKHRAKAWKGRHGDAKYEAMAKNRLLWPDRLRDGRQVYEFLRSNPHWGGPGRASGRELAESLSPRVIEALVRSRGVSIIYTHFCAQMTEDGLLPQPTLDALRRLAALARERRILVTTTRRLLGYCRARQEVRGELRPNADGTWTLALRHESAVPDMQLPEADLAGLTFYVPEPARTEVLWGGLRMHGVRVNPPDDTGQPSLSIPWRPLELPRIGSLGVASYAW